MKINYFDIHSHLESSKFDKDREEVISRMQDEGVFTITVGTDLENSKRAVRIADKYENIFASIGLHPTDSKEDFREEDYIELVKNPKVVAVGECGLEFFRLGENAEDEKQRQIDIFKKQIDFAVKHDKPLMVHVREAHIETIEILEEKKKEYENYGGRTFVGRCDLRNSELRGNIHFFSGDVDLAKRYIDLGFTISFTGVITFANQYDEVIKEISLNKIMSETDSPFVAPEPHRGQKNEPLYVKEVVKRISEIKGLEYEEVKKAMVENAIRFFEIKVKDKNH